MEREKGDLIFEAVRQAELYRQLWHECAEQLDAMRDVFDILVDAYHSRTRGRWTDAGARYRQAN